MTRADEPAAAIDLAKAADFRLGSLAASPSTARVRGPSGEQRIEPRVMQVLLVLVRAEGRTVTRDELIDACWGGRVVSDDAVTRVVAQVRALGRSVEPPPFTLETLPRIGFRLTPGAAGAEAGEPERVQAPQTEAPPKPPRRKGWTGPRVLLAGALVLAVIAIGAWGLWLKPGVKPSPRGRIEVAALSASSDRESAQFAHDLRYNVIDVLNESGQQTFATGEPTDGVKSTPADLVFGGSVSRQDKLLKVILTLTESRSGAILWTGRYERPVEAADRLADEVGVAAAEIAYTALEPRQQRGLKLDPEVLALYIRGEELVSNPTTIRRGEAITLLEKLVARAPNFAAGHAVLAVALAMEARVAPEAAKAAIFKHLQKEVDAAVRVDASQAGAAFDALYLMRRSDRPFDLIGAEDSLLAQLHRAPDHPYLQMRECRLLVEVGRARAAINSCQRAVALRPLSGGIGFSYVRALNMAGETELAKIALARAIRRNPDSVVTRYSEFMMEAFGGRVEDAAPKLEALNALIGLAPEELAAFRAYLVARRSGRAQDIDKAARITVAAAQAGQLDPDLATRILGGLGRIDDAYGLLDSPKLLAAGVLAGGGFIFNADLAPMRADPRFWPLAARAGLAQYWIKRDAWPDFCGKAVSLDVCKAQARRALQVAGAAANAQ